MAKNDPPNGGKPDSRSLEFLRAVETLKDAKELSCIPHVKSGAVVAHKHGESIPVHTGGSNLNLS